MTHLSTYYNVLIDLLTCLHAVALLLSQCYGQFGELKYFGQKLLISSSAVGRLYMA